MPDDVTAGDATPERNLSAVDLVQRADELRRIAELLDSVALTDDLRDRYHMLNHGNKDLTRLAAEVDSYWKTLARQRFNPPKTEGTAL